MYWAAIRRVNRLPILALLAGLVQVAGAQPTAAQEQRRPGAAQGSDPKVTLVQPGAAPHHLLRLHPAKGTTFNTEMVMRMDMQQSVGGQPMPHTTLPPIRMVMRTDVNDVRSDGVFVCKVVYTTIEAMSDPNVDPNTSSMIDSMLKSMQGMEGTMEVTDRGFNRSVVMNVPENANPMVKQQIENTKASLRQICMPLPEAEVGIGAQWDSETEFESGGLRLKQISHYTLKQFDGTNMTLGVTIEQSAAPQDVHAPGMPPNAKLHLDKLASTGEGTSVVPLNGCVPSKSSVSMKSQTTMQATIGSTPQQIEQTMQMSVELNEAPASAAGATSKSTGQGTPPGH